MNSTAKLDSSSHLMFDYYEKNGIKEKSDGDSIILNKKK